MIPLFILVIAKFMFRKSITWKESAASFAATTLIVVVMVTGFLYGSTMDSEVWNGYVTSKESEHVSCDHSYRCHCRKVQSCSGSGKNRSCSTSESCSTCYEHSYDIDWVVHSTVGDIKIDRVDRRGTSTPPRWSSVVEGEYFATENIYQNVIKISRDSLFTYDKTNYDEFSETLPDYPDVYDYYRFNHVINLASIDVTGWNDRINEYLRTAGSSKQLNIIVVTTTKPEIWSESLLYKWYGGKKNDVVVILGVNETDKTKVSWFKGATFANGIGNQELLVTLRNDMIGSTVNQGLVDTMIKDIDQKFTRLSADQMEYLRDSAVPPTWMLILTIFLGTIVSVGISYYFHKNDVL